VTAPGDDRRGVAESVLPNLPPWRLRRTPGRRYRGHRRPRRAAGNHPRTQPRRMRGTSAGLTTLAANGQLDTGAHTANGQLMHTLTADDTW